MAEGTKTLHRENIQHSEFDSNKPSARDLIPRNDRHQNQVNREYKLLQITAL